MMLNTIRSAPEPAPSEETAVDLLLGCHQRIRHFTNVALRLAQNPGAPAEDRAQAASAVVRYFTIALPLHEADENDSVYPRLREALTAGALAEANEAMVEQHRGINAALSQLIPLWQTVESDPARQKSLQPLLATTTHLQSLWDVHLKLEEEQVVPAMRQYLTEYKLQEIYAEMRNRRQG